MMRSVIAIAALVASVLASASHASDVRDNWDVTSYENGIPQTAIYSDSNMRIKLTAQETLPREGGGWKVDFVTASIYSNQDLLRRRRDKPGRISVLGYFVADLAEGVMQIDSRQLVVKNIPVLEISCGGPTFSQWAYRNSTADLSFPVQGLDSMDYYKLLEQWRDSSPFLRTGQERRWLFSAVSPMDASGLATLSDEQRTQEGDWYQPESCIQHGEDYLERSRQKRADEQARLDKIDSLIEGAHSQGDVMLITNQKLLECKLEPRCEAQVLEDVDNCKKTSEGRYIESCIRAIEPPR